MISRRTLLLGGASAASSAYLLGASGAQVFASPRKIDEFIDYDSTGLAEIIRSGEISQSELVEIVIRRIETLNPILNFMTTPTYNRARKKAGNIPINSAFAGVPILMKDMIDVGGVRRTDGSRLLATNVPKKNVAYVDGIETAGLNIIGMTNVPEFAGGMTCHNDLFGETKNPWNLDYSPLISSGGSAAAAAAGILPMVHGTDGAGSNRLPSSTCGLFGFKPSRFRMMSGEAGGGHDRTKTNNTIGRSVRDSARLMNFTEDKSGKHYPPIGLVEGPSSKRLRIGFVEDAPGITEVSPEVKAAQRSVAKLLEDLGHEIVEAQWPVDVNKFAKSYPAYFATRLIPLKNMIEAMTGVSVTKSGLLTTFQATFAAGAVSVPQKDVEEAEAFLETVPELFKRSFSEIDIILCPVMTDVGIKNTEFNPAATYSPEIMEQLLGSLKFTGPVNFAGNPAMSVPLTWNSTDGLPIGSHFIAPLGNDRTLYEIAFELEQARPWKDKWAPYSARFIPA